MNSEKVQIISFYEFKDMAQLGPLEYVRTALKELFRQTGVRGTIILAHEGYNGMACGTPEQVSEFIPEISKIVDTCIDVTVAYDEKPPFRRIDVKIKSEIVTLKRPVDMSLADGTHVLPSEWDALISDPETLILDTRNSYEYETGTFRGAVNPNIKKFSELPAFVQKAIDPQKHRRVAMFCTGGIRCEKFAPFLKQIGFEEVYQLKGGILRYLQQTAATENLWEGECFVFDERVTVDAELKRGRTPDLSQRIQKRKKYKAAG
jgi:UPF0176 protein